MQSFEINGRSYQASRMDVMKQWAVARRVAPLIVRTMEPKLLKQAAAMFQNLPKAEDGAPPAMDAFVDLLAAVAQPFMDAIGAMKDEDSEFVIGTCLATVQMAQKPAGWANIWTPGAGLRFQEIDLLEMIQIVVRVIMGNLANFSVASLLSLGGTTPAQESSS